MYDTTYQAGATSKIVKVRAWTLSTGAPCTTLTNATSGLAVHYCRDGATQQTISQVSASSGTYTTSGFVHQGDGIYEIGAPIASLAAGSDGVVFSASGVTDVVFSVTRVDLTGTDPRSSTAPDVNVTSIGGTTQTARDLGASVLISSGTGTGQLDVTSGVISANTKKINSATVQGDGTAGNLWRG